MLVGLRRTQPRTRRQGVHVRAATDPGEHSRSTRAPSCIAFGLFFVLTDGRVPARAALRALRTSAACSISTILFAPLIVILSLALSEAGDTNVIQLLVESLRLGTPIALGAMAGLWCERSGVVNIAHRGHDARRGRSRLHDCTWSLGDAQRHGLAVDLDRRSRCSPAVSSPRCTRSSRSRFRVDQIISGVVINLLALGLTSFLRSQVIVPRGISTGVSTSDISIPVPVRHPGDRRAALQEQADLLRDVRDRRPRRWFVLFKTPWGLRVRSCGENPHAAETLGINVIKIRYQAVILGGLIAGLAGAWFSMESQGGFQDNMTNGVGFIALAALIFGRWRPWSAFAGAMLFGFTRALGTRLQILGVTDRELRDPERVLAVAAVRRHDRRRGRRGRARDPAGGGRSAVRAIAMTVPMGTDGQTSTGTDCARRTGDRAARVRRRTRTCRSARPRSSTTAGIVTGCNVENASYGLTLCAECGLVSALHASGGGRLVAFACVDGATGAIRSRRAAAAASSCGKRAAPRCWSTPKRARSRWRRCSPGRSAPKTCPLDRGRHRHHPDQARRRDAHRRADRLVPAGVHRG